MVADNGVAIASEAQSTLPFISIRIRDNQMAAAGLMFRKKTRARVLWRVNPAVADRLVTGLVIRPGDVGHSGLVRHAGQAYGGNQFQSDRRAKNSWPLPRRSLARSRS